MPKRTNDFQAMIFLVKSHLARDAAVTESAMLADLVTGTEREVDILIETTVAGSTVRVCIECRDYKRTQSVGFVEEMHTKHMRLPTNVLVLASSSGFSREAKAVATAYGIELVQPSAMDDARADAIVNRIDQLTMKKVDMRSTKVKAMMGATEHQGEEVVRTEADNLVLFENGDEFGVMGEIANHLLRAADASAELEKATGEEKFFVVDVDPLTIDLGDNGGVQQLWMRKEHPVRHLVPIRAILVEGEAEVEIREIPMTYQQLQGSSFAYGHTTFGEHRALLVLTDEGRQDGPQLSLRIKD